MALRLACGGGPSTHMRMPGGTGHAGGNGRLAAWLRAVGLSCMWRGRMSPVFCL